MTANKCFLCGTSEARMELRKIILITDDDEELTAIPDNIKILGTFYYCENCECVRGIKSWQNFITNAIDEEIERRIKGDD